jgi:transcriptional/translational regulatory protein YebC/TACO1
MQKPIRLTRHAVQRALKYDLQPETIEKIIYEGQREPEGKEKTRYTINTKNGVWVAICQETPEYTIIITITKERIKK